MNYLLLSPWTIGVGVLGFGVVYARYRIQGRYWYDRTAKPVDLTDKTVLVTGANSGIGYASAYLFAKSNANVVMICRNEQRGNEAKNKLESALPNRKGKIQLELADLANFKSVNKFLDRWNNKPLDILINNAGGSLKSLK
eukprot:UN02787